MRVTLAELRAVIAEAVRRTIREEDVCAPSEYTTAPQLDFSAPLGPDNLYRRQGASNVGPFTGEAALRMCVQGVIGEVLSGKKKG